MCRIKLLPINSTNKGSSWHDIIGAALSEAAAITLNNKLPSFPPECLIIKPLSGVLRKNKPLRCRWSESTTASELLHDHQYGRAHHSAVGNVSRRASSESTRQVGPHLMADFKRSDSGSYHRHAGDYAAAANCTQGRKRQPGIGSL